MNRNFLQLLQARRKEGKFVCAGLDSRFSSIPQLERWSGLSKRRKWETFNREIVAATHDQVLCYKPNAAFYEGSTGNQVLEATCDYIRHRAPRVVLILDAKRGDIDNTNLGTVEFLFDTCGADAITVHPYLGMEAMKPFLDRADKGVIALCRTSNLGAGEFQDRLVHPKKEEAERWGITPDAMPFYQLVAYRVSREWNYNGNCAVVVGATYPEELKIVRDIVGDMPILIPGVGAQGGSVEEAVINGQNSQGEGFIINSSRGIIFASKGADFAEAARKETLALHTSIKDALRVAA